MKFYLVVLFTLGSLITYSQAVFKTVSKTEATAVKNQANTGTCWSFSTTSLVESESLHKNLGEFDLSEMYIVRKIYVDKAKNYVLRQGAAQFGPGGLGHDVINGMRKYGAVPESAYSGLLLGSKQHDHNKMDASLKSFLDSLLKQRPIPSNWLVKYENILDEYLGKVPPTFVYNEKTYTPETFAKDVIKFKADDYVFLTSFSHHPFYEKFVLEIPDNYANESYYNVQLDELMGVIEQALKKGYSIMWDADVSNKTFRQKEGYALMPVDNGSFSPNAKEIDYNQNIRQQLFEELTTQDDHLMHIVGMEVNDQGKKFFLVKNSWGEIGPFKGYIKVSEAYMAINTITLVLPKAALDKNIKDKLKLD